MGNEKILVAWCEILPEYRREFTQILTAHELEVGAICDVCNHPFHFKEIVYAPPQSETKKQNCPDCCSGMMVAKVVSEDLRCVQCNRSVNRTETDNEITMRLIEEWWLEKGERLTAIDRSVVDLQLYWLSKEGK